VDSACPQPPLRAGEAASRGRVRGAAESAAPALGGAAVELVKLRVRKATSRFGKQSSAGSGDRASSEEVKLAGLTHTLGLKTRIGISSQMAGPT
jgi:hypothetical protein